MKDTKQMTKDGYKYEYSKDDVLAEFVINEVCYSTLVDPQWEEIWLDAGANIGKFSLPMSDKVRRIYAYEPVPSTFKYLFNNLRLNGIKNVVTINNGLWTKEAGIANLYRHNGSTGNDSMYLDKNRDFNEVPIKIHMSNYESAIKFYNINCLKMDTEGGEYEFIMDMPHMLEKLDKFIFEYHQRQYEDWDLVKYNNMLLELGKYFNHVKPIGEIHHFCQLINCY